MITEPRAWNRLMIVACGIMLFILTLNPTVPYVTAVHVCR